MIPLVFVLLVAVALTAVRFFFNARLANVLDRRFGPLDADGRLPDRTLGAKLGGGLPFDTGMVAQIGAGARARMSLNTTIMRPTIGVRGLSVGLSGLVLYLVWGNPGAYFPAGQGMSLGITAFLLYGVLRIMFYEVRYDNRTLATTNWLFQTCEFEMNTLVALRDNGHHLYKLRFENGKTIEVQKYLVGMPDFLSYALFIMDLNAKN